MDNKFVSLELKDLLLLNQSGTWGKVGNVNDIPVLRSTNIHHGRLVLDDIAYRKIAKNYIKKYKLGNGDILVTKSSGSQELVGKCCRFLSFDKRVFVFSNFVQRLRVDPEKLDANYLFFYLVSPYAKAVLKKISNTTSGLRNLHMQDYERQLVPVPFLSVQRKIASILEKAEFAKQKRQEANRLTDEYLKSAFLQMFGDPVKNIKRWETRTVGELTSIKSGGTPSRKETEYFNGKIPWITTVALNKIYINKNNAMEFITSKAIEDSATSLIPARSVLLGSRVGVGKTAINLCDICASQDVLGLISREKAYLPEYLLFVLRSFTPFLTNNQRGATIKGITIDLVKRLNIPLPPFELQQKFADLVQKVEALKTKQHESEKELDNLFNSLMQKAFKGDLFIEEK